eukprot:1145918-Pelagomonas_calceolata.AAC.6
MLSEAISKQTKHIQKAWCSGFVFYDYKYHSAVGRDPEVNRLWDSKEEDITIERCRALGQIQSFL